MKKIWQIAPWLLNNFIGFLQLFSLCGNNVLRRHVKIDGISTETLIEYTSEVTSRVE